MDEYKEIVEYYNSILLFKLSQIGYALNCDLLISDRLELLPINKCLNLLKYLKDGDKLFINLCANRFMEYFYIIYNNIKLLNIKLTFYLMFEPYVNHNIIELLLPISYNIFANNNNYSHPKVHCMPIGIRDCGIITKSMHDNFHHSYLYNEGLKNVSKKHLCLIGGFANTNPDRLISYNTLKNKSFIYDIYNFNYSINLTSKYGNIPIYKYYNFIHLSYYAIAPYGAGVDTHRFFEILYLKTIPIVKKTNTPFDKLYDIFPCLVINEWSDINEDLLNSNLPILQSKIDEFNKKYPNCYFNNNVLDELLLQT